MKAPPEQPARFSADLCCNPPQHMHICATMSRLLVAFSLLLFASAAHPASILVPNTSFESPATDFASPFMSSWQKAPQPIWYNDPRFPWSQLAGQFLNTSNGAPDHIDNLDGQQAAYLFALPDVAIFQDYNTIAGSNAVPSREFNAQFEAGRSYTLTVGVLGGG